MSAARQRTASAPVRAARGKEGCMRHFVINLSTATERRRRTEAQFGELGLDLEIHSAVDGSKLNSRDIAGVDLAARRNLGIWPPSNGEIAVWISHCQIFRQLLDSRDSMIAVFEDDAELSPDLPKVLEALECRPFDFDIAKLNRRSPKKPFVPFARLTDEHMAGHVQYSDYGAEGYVITRSAAERFLDCFPRMTTEIDHALSRFWETRLNVIYIDPPVVAHRGVQSLISEGRERSRRRHRTGSGAALAAFRRISAGLRRRQEQRRAWPRLLQGEIGQTRWSRAGPPTSQDPSAPTGN